MPDTPNASRVEPADIPQSVIDVMRKGFLDDDAPDYDAPEEAWEADVQKYLAKILSLPDVQSLVAAAVRSDVLAQVREKIAQLDWSGPVSGVGCTVRTDDLYTALSDLAEGKP